MSAAPAHQTTPHHVRHEDLDHHHHEILLVLRALAGGVDQEPHQDERRQDSAGNQQQVDAAVGALGATVGPRTTVARGTPVTEASRVALSANADLANLTSPSSCTNQPTNQPTSQPTVQRPTTRPNTRSPMNARRTRAQRKCLPHLFDLSHRQGSWVGGAQASL